VILFVNFHPNFTKTSVITIFKSLHPLFSISLASGLACWLLQFGHNNSAVASVGHLVNYPGDVVPRSILATLKGISAACSSPFSFLRGVSVVIATPHHSSLFELHLPPRSCQPLVEPPPRPLPAAAAARRTGCLAPAAARPGWSAAASRPRSSRPSTGAPALRSAPRRRTTTPRRCP
jgi:hypothetical protein